MAASLRILAAAAAAAAVAVAHNQTCTEEQTANGDVTCDAAEPAWIKYFSVAAAGPEQIFINFGDDASDMVVGWATTDDVDSRVEWGTASGVYTGNARGASETYTYSSKYTSPHLHHATMTNLQAKTKYFYRVGDGTTWSNEYSFTSNAVGADQFPYVLGTYADLGENNNAVSTVTHLLSSNADSLLLIGDMSYASGCEKNGCTTWDAFQRMIEPLSATVPTHVELGNRESWSELAAGWHAVCCLPPTCVACRLRARLAAALPLLLRQPTLLTLFSQRTKPPFLQTSTTTSSPASRARARATASRACPARGRTTSTTSRGTRARCTASRSPPSTRASRRPAG